MQIGDGDYVAGVCSLGKDTALCLAVGAPLAHMGATATRIILAADAIGGMTMLGCAGVLLVDGNSDNDFDGYMILTDGMLSLVGVSAGQILKLRALKSQGIARADDLAHAIDDAADAARGVSPAGGSARFYGKPFAFGTGSRSARVSSLVDEAAAASGIDDLARYVDDVVYDPAGSYFTVENGHLILSIGHSAFARTRTGQLLEAGHELVHAQQFERFMTRGGYKSVDDAADHFFTVSDRIYARQERVAEHLSRLRIRKYLGGMSPQQWAAGTRYIDEYR